ncbi:MAG: hypothetical protein K2I06_12595 [Ruminococcus sp.]|nr:hypothetical protein [Ruminococcus sp.]MDE5860987.1 hypothetical protein [Ruminococcus sp.]
MAKSIITQERNLVNYANIVTITVEISDDGDVYGLIATDTGNSIHILGTYPSENMAVSAKNRLIDWLNSEALGVYSVDENGGDDYGE